MLFNSLDFAIFFPIVFVLYWLVARNVRWRNILILSASYVFYGWWDWRFLFLIIISSIVDYIVGLQLHKSGNNRKRGALLLFSLMVNLGFLIYFKYANFFIETFVDSFRLFGMELQKPTLDIILPVGISFYTFQTLSYTIDIYRKRLEPTRNWLAFFSFVAFFPQLVAGPIERASHLLPQFYKAYKFDYQAVRSGLLLMAFGLFKKMVIADRVSELVNYVYNDAGQFGGYEVVIATFFFAVQIYCDFSGYSDIAIGLSRTLGFDLMKNFDSPYFSKSITEFWRRWHISLSTWFRDYVYISLGGNRKGKIRVYINLIIVFLVSGLWHGAAMTFIIWGAVHAVFIVVEKAFQPARDRIFASIGVSLNAWFTRFVFMIFTFVIVCFAWVFFRANSVADAFSIVGSTFQNNYSEVFNQGLYNLGMSRVDFIASIVAIVLLVVFEVVHKRFNATRLLLSRGFVVRWAAYLVIVFVLLIFGIYGDSAPKEFIYFQF